MIVFLGHTGTPYSIIVIIIQVYFRHSEINIKKNKDTHLQQM